MWLCTVSLKALGRKRWKLISKYYHVTRLEWLRYTTERSGFTVPGPVFVSGAFQVEMLRNSPACAVQRHDIHTCIHTHSDILYAFLHRPTVSSILHFHLYFQLFPSSLTLSFLLFFCTFLSFTLLIFSLFPFYILPLFYFLVLFPSFVSYLRHSF